MRRMHVALGCALTGGLGFLALPAGTALADGTVVHPVHADHTAPVDHTGHADQTAHADHTGHANQTAHAAEPGAAPAMSISAPTIDNSYGAWLTLTVTLGPTSGDGQVALYATPAGGARTFVASGTVDAEGQWDVTYSITRATTFTAVFAGDAHDAPASASLTLYAYADVTDRLGGSDKTTKSDGVVYDVFPGAGTLTLYSTVAPNKRGECLEPETEQYNKGAGWIADTKYGCDKLDGLSHDAAPFTLSQAAGDEYRIRGDYLRDAKDKANLNAQGPWLYFIVTK